MGSWDSVKLTCSFRLLFADLKMGKWTEGLSCTTLISVQCDFAQRETTLFLIVRKVERGRLANGCQVLNWKRCSLRRVTADVLRQWSFSPNVDPLSL